jgi:hypothetical protein
MRINVLCYAIYAGHATRLFPFGPPIFQVKPASAVPADRCGVRGGRGPRSISLVIRVRRREIEAQLIGSMLVLDTAADATISRTGNR